VISDVVAAISQAITDELGAMGLPQLVDGRVQVGDRYTDDPGAPRIWMIPDRVDYGPAAATGATTADRRAAMLQRPLATKSTHLEVHVLGPAIAPDDPRSRDFTEMLGELVIWAAQQVAPGSFGLDDGGWQRLPGVVQAPPQTHHYVFGLVIHAPVGDKPTRPRLAFVPPGTTQEATISYQGSLETESA
jgi:hypothetical protein